MTCGAYLLIAKLLFVEASGYNTMGLEISEYNTVSRASYYMSEYRKCKG